MTTTKVIGEIIVDGESFLVYVAATDGTAAELTIRDLSGSLKNAKDILAGKNLTAIRLLVGTPSDLDLVQMKDKGGGIVYEFKGAINAALGLQPQLDIDNINFPIDDGCAIEVTTTD
jgi:hypothetical protein